jgi:transposase InsO family protein
MNTTDSRHSPPVAENLLNREFRVGGPGEKRVSDITYLKTDGEWRYLTVIPDLWDRRVIGWAFSEDGEAGHVCDALMMARTNREPKSGLLFHSDRGVQYCSKEFREVLGTVSAGRTAYELGRELLGQRLCGAFFQDVKSGTR